jgi:hypothetical protein
MRPQWQAPSIFMRIAFPLSRREDSRKIGRNPFRTK